MSLTRADFLWKWDARYGLSTRLGHVGSPVLTRGGTGQHENRDGTLVTMPAGKPRYQYTTVNNERRAAHRLEGADSETFYWDAPPAPQAVGIYVRYIYRASVASAGILCLGNAEGTASLILRMTDAGTAPGIRLNNGSTVNSSYAAAGTNPGTNGLMEILGIATGSVVRLAVRLNGGTVTSTADAAITLPSAWGANTLYINSVGTGQINSASYLDAALVKWSALSGLASDTDRMNAVANFDLDPFGRILG